MAFFKEMVMRMMSLAAGALMLLTGCEVSQDMAVEKGKDMVASALKDPDSASFSGVYMLETDVIGDTHYGYLCGVVNSKNSFGGYTGNRRFSARFQYSTGGQLEVSYLQLEEGRNAKEMSDGVTFFESFYWRKRCLQGEAQPVITKAPEPKGSLMALQVGQRSLPAKQKIITRLSPDLTAATSLPIEKGQIVTVQEAKEGWIRISKDPASPQWIVPELVDWASP
ncbi:hypothetical protein AO897_15805 [Pseudomonas aeruginosa]|jgi:hypothetical protein|nr:hypothetical protein AO897_15805 [Pseudomonas aeruginosa]KSF29652.1 hypothetical protein AO933_22090 [Pseudomonas aeruginosa]RIY99698.1 hypothetical protein AXW97_23425 [Pseudomonas aeruginosa]RPV65984.1 hypothetical protein IPC838_09715 [Pseudomonas aeruginosa]HBP6824284.1 hypothetical protein [Pseudomonas aeruginosa]